MERYFIIMILFLCFHHLNAAEAHIMEFILEGMHFDSLRIVTYDSSKDEVLMYATRPVSERWVTEVPDNTWKMNPKYVLGKSDEKQQKYEYICFYDRNNLNYKKTTVPLPIHILTDGDDVKINGTYVDSDTIFDNKVMLIYHNFSVLPMKDSGVYAMIKYPDFGDFTSQITQNEQVYNKDLNLYISATKDSPDSRFLALRLLKNINKFHSSRDVKKVYSCFSESIKKSDTGKEIATALQKDWTLFVNDSLTNVISGRREKIVNEEKKFKLICFTASWCTNCRQEVPLLKEIYNELKEYSFEMVYVSVDRDRMHQELFKKQIKEDMIPWRSFYSYPLNIEDKYLIQAYPTNMLVYPDRHTEFLEIRNSVGKEKLYTVVKNIAAAEKL